MHYLDRRNYIYSIYIVSLSGQGQWLVASWSRGKHTFPSSLLLTFLQYYFSSSVELLDLFLASLHAFLQWGTKHLIVLEVCSFSVRQAGWNQRESQKTDDDYDLNAWSSLQQICSLWTSCTSSVSWNCSGIVIPHSNVYKMPPAKHTTWMKFSNDLCNSWRVNAHYLVLDSTMSRSQHDRHRSLGGLISLLLHWVKLKWDWPPPLHLRSLTALLLSVLCSDQTRSEGMSDRVER